MGYTPYFFGVVNWRKAAKKTPNNKQKRNYMTKRKRAMKSFEADRDVEQMLDEAIINGAVLREVVNEAIRKYGPSILAEQVKRLREQADKIERKISGGKR